MYRFFGLPSMWFTSQEALEDVMPIGSSGIHVCNKDVVNLSGQCQGQCVLMRMPGESLPNVQLASRHCILKVVGGSPQWTPAEDMECVTIHKVQERLLNIAYTLVSVDDVFDQQIHPVFNRWQNDCSVPAAIAGETLPSLIRQGCFEDVKPCFESLASTWLTISPWKRFLSRSASSVPLSAVSSCSKSCMKNSSTSICAEGFLGSEGFLGFLGLGLGLGLPSVG